MSKEDRGWSPGNGQANTENREEACFRVQAMQSRKGFERCVPESGKKRIFGILVQFHLRDQRKGIYTDEEKQM